MGIIDIPQHRFTRMVKGYPRAVACFQLILPALPEGQIEKDAIFHPSIAG
jgi:hypothetical protein